MEQKADTIELKEVAMDAVDLLVIGPNKSGKSTLLRQLEQLLMGNNQGMTEIAEEDDVAGKASVDIGMRIFKTEYSFPQSG